MGPRTRRAVVKGKRELRASTNLLRQEKVTHCRRASA